MSVSGVGSGSGYPSVEAAEAAAVKRGVSVLKKQQDVAKDQGQALVDMIKTSTDSTVGSQINVYA